MMKWKWFLALGIFIFTAALTAQSTHSNTLTLTQGGTSVTASQQCTSTQSCTMQLYSQKSACPTSIGAGTWTPLTTTQAATSTTATGSSWTYVDPTTSGQITCYYATVTFTSGGAASSPSNMFSATTPTDTPAAPTLSGVVK